MKNLELQFLAAKMVEFSARFVLVIIAFLAIFYVASSNWDWYVDELELQIEHPKWGNPTVNLYLVSIFFGIFALVWNKHHLKHKEQMKIDLFYPFVIILLFVTFTLFFEQRDFKLSRWFGVLSIINLAIILYDSFFVDAIVSGMLIVELSILVYIVAQIWYYSKGSIKRAEHSTVQHSEVFWAV